MAQALNVRFSSGFRRYCILTFLPDTDVKLGAATIKAQSIGVATRSNGFQDVDGILGIGPVDRYSFTNRTATIPTVTDVCFTVLSTAIVSNVVFSTEPQVTKPDSKNHMVLP